MVCRHDVYHGFREASNQSVQFIRTDGIQATDVIRLFDDVVLTEREQHVTEALRIIDQSIERIASVGPNAGPCCAKRREGCFSKLRGVPYRVPNGQFGRWHGCECSGLPSRSRTRKGGILLVDEIDTGLHYSVMEDMWRMVSERATALDVQVFATTHSRDCYESLAAVVAPGSISTAVTIQPNRSKPWARDWIFE